MIEVEEVKVELEDPTEIDAERVFEVFKKSLETIQQLLVSEKKQMEKDGVDCKRLSLEIEPTEITIRVGDYLLWHKIEHACHYIP